MASAQFCTDGRPARASSRSRSGRNTGERSQGLAASPAGGGEPPRPLPAGRRRPAGVTAASRRCPRRRPAKGPGAPPPFARRAGPARDRVGPRSRPELGALPGPGRASRRPRGAPSGSAPRLPVPRLRVARRAVPGAGSPRGGDRSRPGERPRSGPASPDSRPLVISPLVRSVLQSSPQSRQLSSPPGKKHFRVAIGTVSVASGTRQPSGFPLKLVETPTLPANDSLLGPLGGVLPWPDESPTSPSFPSSRS